MFVDVFCGKMSYSLTDDIFDIVVIPVDFRSKFW